MALQAAIEIQDAQHQAEVVVRRAFAARPLLVPARGIFVLRNEIADDVNEFSHLRLERAGFDSRHAGIQRVYPVRVAFENAKVVCNG